MLTVTHLDAQFNLAEAATLLISSLGALWPLFWPFKLSVGCLHTVVCFDRALLFSSSWSIPSSVPDRICEHDHSH